MKKRTVKTLSLHRETLRTLEADQTRKVAGGSAVCTMACGTADCPVLSVNNCIEDK